MNRDGVSDLPVLAGNATAKLPFVWETLDAGIFPDGERAGFNGMAAVRLFLCGGSQYRQGWLI
jgi:hypothetical protein